MHEIRDDGRHEGRQERPHDGPLELGVIVGSTRPGRRCHPVATWFADLAATRDDVRPTLIDIADHGLPLLDEPLPAITGVYEHDHTRRWSAAIAPLDAFVFVTPEYNHSIPAALKNAIDFLYDEWKDKPAGIVSYGADAAGVRAAEQLRLVLAEVHVADVRQQVALSLLDDYADGVLSPRARKSQDAHALLDQVAAWGRALRPLRRAQMAVTS
jgi:NAD(P)H-dependent FMN reductase